MATFERHLPVGGQKINAKSFSSRCLCDFAALREFLLFAFFFLPFAVQGQSGLAFLKIGVGGRAAGLGEAYVAAANDPTAIYWNAAGLDPGQGTVAVFRHPR